MISVMRLCRRFVIVATCLGASVAAAGKDFAPEIAPLRIPRVTRAPKLSDFVEGRPREAEAVITVFKQFDPHEGVIELRQGFGAFVAGNSAESGAQRKFLRALPAMRAAVNRIAQLGLDEQQMRRLFETELTRLRKGSQHD